MSRSLPSFAAIVAVVVGPTLSVACGGAPSAFADADKPAFVDAHNNVRAAASPAPTPALPALTWDDGLATTAQAWSSRCVFEHSPSTSAGGSLGENLAFFSGDASTPRATVDEWASEVQFYDYGDNSCDAGQQCGHYTQVVWRDTTKVGCGASTCNIQGFDGIYWVCNYDPPGNFVGEKPY